MNLNDGVEPVKRWKAEDVAFAGDDGWRKLRLDRGYLTGWRAGACKCSALADSLCSGRAIAR